MYLMFFLFRFKESILQLTLTCDLADQLSNIISLKPKVFKDSVELCRVCFTNTESPNPVCLSMSHISFTCWWERLFLSYILLTQKRKSTLHEAEEGLYL